MRLGFCCQTFHLDSHTAPQGTRFSLFCKHQGRHHKDRRETLANFSLTSRTGDLRMSLYMPYNCGKPEWPHHSRKPSHIKQAVVHIGAPTHVMHLATAELCHIFQWPEACENSASHQSSYQHCRRSHNHRFTGRHPESVSPLQYLTKWEICSPSFCSFATLNI